ncbi:MAG: hypothetical protein AYK19_10320 [Theionarchaea archaeon DG-70-1]|nr:MAG: hypothetical protein AYK19_10320 [Theionarchaea archaeon DG-70-1]
MIRIPTPFHVGDVNVYIVGDTLIDAGPKTAEALDVIKTIDLKMIKNVVITHGHVDHHGLAFYTKEISGCTVFVHEDDLSAVSDYKDYLMGNLKKYKAFLEKTEISREFVKQFVQYYRLFEKYGENCEAEKLGKTLETEEGVLTVIHTPGHTPGSCCFLLGDVLYSGDTLLPTISTNPSVHAIFDERCGLESFQKSLDTISQLPLKKVLPGHGTVIRDHRKRVQEILQEHTERREKVIACLSMDPQPLVEVTRKVFGEVPVSEVILALAECYNHLKILEKEGIVKISEKECYYFTL